MHSSQASVQRFQLSVLYRLVGFPPRCRKILAFGSGSPVPMGGGRGWSSAINVRHTAKGLDLLLLQDRFCAEDVEVLHSILSTQAEDGSLPQVVGGDSDLWATAYVMNLLIRVLNGSHARATTPRKKDQKQWSSELTTELSRARDRAEIRARLPIRSASHGPGVQPCSVRYN